MKHSHIWRRRWGRIWTIPSPPPVQISLLCLQHHSAFWIYSCSSVHKFPLFLLSTYNQSKVTFCLHLVSNLNLRWCHGIVKLNQYRFIKVLLHWRCYVRCRVTAEPFQQEANNFTHREKDKYMENLELNYSQPNPELLLSFQGYGTLVDIFLSSPRCSLFSQAHSTHCSSPCKSTTALPLRTIHTSPPQPP